MQFEFGTCTVPDGKLGPWAVASFTLTKEDVALENLRAAFNGRGYAICAPGTYKQLTHERRGIVMSNTPMEIRTARECYRGATGRVLINGLGLGMVLEGVLSKPDVTHVRVVEIDSDVIALVGPHFAGQRVEIVHANAYEYKPPRGEKFDYVWHDIWDEICADNLPLMSKLTRRYSRIAANQGVWSREETRRHARRYG